MKYKLKIPVFNAVLTVATSWQELNIKGEEPFRDEDVGGYYCPEYWGIVLLEPSIKTLVHEVTHYVCHLMADRGLYDEETRCYLTGYIVETLVKKGFGRGANAK